MNAEQTFAAENVLTWITPKKSFCMLQAFLAKELPTTEWKVYEQVCPLSVDLSQHLFDTPVSCDDLVVFLYFLHHNRHSVLKK